MAFLNTLYGGFHILRCLSQELFLEHLLLCTAIPRRVPEMQVPKMRVVAFLWHLEIHLAF